MQTYQSPGSQSTTTGTTLWTTSPHRKIAITPARTPSIAVFAFNSGAAFLVALGEGFDGPAAARVTADVEGVEPIVAVEVLEELGVVDAAKAAFVMSDTNGVVTEFQVKVAAVATSAVL